MFPLNRWPCMWLFRVQAPSIVKLPSSRAQRPPIAWWGLGGQLMEVQAGRLSRMWCIFLPLLLC